MKFSSPPTEHLHDLECHLDHPEKADESGLLIFHINQTQDKFKLFLQEGQFRAGNLLFITILLRGILCASYTQMYQSNVISLIRFRQSCTIHF